MLILHSASASRRKRMVNQTSFTQDKDSPILFSSWYGYLPLAKRDE